MLCKRNLHFEENFHAAILHHEETKSTKKNALPSGGKSLFRLRASWLKFVFAISSFWLGLCRFLDV
jgi:hypothetical protein